MNYYNYLSQLQTATTHFKSCSLVNAQGQLLFSKDENKELLTTSRLVAFQIINKYLQPKPQDLFILNDPENGGFDYGKFIFVSCLDSNLFLIFDENFYHCDIKIPPTPLFDAGKLNSFIWDALSSQIKKPEALKQLIDSKKQLVDQILNKTDLIKSLSLAQHQNNWLKTSQIIFKNQFSAKAQGSSELVFQFKNKQILKLKISIEEKQNIQMITADFTNTSSALDYSTASHVVESALVVAVTQYYQIKKFLNQAILDKIKIILPPKSVVSKASANGVHNFEIQELCFQLAEHILQTLNTNNKKKAIEFNHKPSLVLKLNNSENAGSLIKINIENPYIIDLENLALNTAIKFSKMTKQENKLSIACQVYSDQDTWTLKLMNSDIIELSAYKMTVCKKTIGNENCLLKVNDVVEIEI